MKDPYSVLGVGREASNDEIQKAYRNLARQWHPDMHRDEEAKKSAQEKFKEVSAAYEMIGSPEKRAKFDRFGAAQSGTANPFSGQWKPFGSFMDDFFNSFGRRQQARGEHIVVEKEITLDQVLNGGEIEVNFKRHDLCAECGGVGGELLQCPECQGTGARVIHGLNMTVRAGCNRCGGSGKILGSACQHCTEGRTGPNECTTKFVIPKGVENGMRFVYSGKGEPCPNGQPGNLYVVVQVKPHDVFKRISQGGIVYRAPVSYTQLVLGCEIEVPTLEGTATVKVPAGTQDYKKFRLRELGLPVFQNQGNIYKRGDQIVELRLEIPTQLNDEYRKLIEGLAEFESSGKSTGD